MKRSTPTLIIDVEPSIKNLEKTNFTAYNAFEIQIQKSDFEKLIEYYNDLYTTLFISFTI